MRDYHVIQDESKVLFTITEKMKVRKRRSSRAVPRPDQATCQVPQKPPPFPPEEDVDPHPGSQGVDPEYTPLTPTADLEQSSSSIFLNDRACLGDEGKIFACQPFATHIPETTASVAASSMDQVSSRTRSKHWKQEVVPPPPPTPEQWGYQYGRGELFPCKGLAESSMTRVYVFKQQHGWSGEPFVDSFPSTTKKPSLPATRSCYVGREHHHQHKHQEEQHKKSHCKLINLTDLEIPSDGSNVLVLNNKRTIFVVTKHERGEALLQQSARVAEDKEDNPIGGSAVLCDKPPKLFCLGPSKPTAHGRLGNNSREEDDEAAVMATCCMQDGDGALLWENLLQFTQ